MKLDKRLILLLGVYLALIPVSAFLRASPALSGLSTILGTILLGTTMLGTTVLSSVLGSSLLGTTMITVYAQALATTQLYISLTCIGLLVYLELTDSAYGGIKKLLLNIRESWISIASLLVILFLLLVAFKVWMIITA